MKKTMRGLEMPFRVSVKQPLQPRGHDKTPTETVWNPDRLRGRSLLHLFLKNKPGSKWTGWFLHPYVFASFVKDMPCSLI
jgi:hypothetical protein